MKENHQYLLSLLAPIAAIAGDYFTGHPAWLFIYAAFVVVLSLALAVMVVAAFALGMAHMAKMMKPIEEPIKLGWRGTLNWAVLLFTLLYLLVCQYLITASIVMMFGVLIAFTFAILHDIRIYQVHMGIVKES